MDSREAERRPLVSKREALLAPGSDQEVASDVVGKRLQVLDELVPGKRTVAVLMNPDTPFSALALRELKAAAAVTAQPIQVFEARSADQVLTGGTRSPHAGRCIAGEYSSANRRARHNDSAAIVYGSRAFPEAGGLISYGVDRRHMYRRAAEYVNMILKGRTPSELPVEQPTKFELVINLKAAKAIALDVPDRLLALADEVIE